MVERSTRTGIDAYFTFGPLSARGSHLSGLTRTQHIVINEQKVNALPHLAKPSIVSFARSAELVVRSLQLMAAFAPFFPQRAGIFVSTGKFLRLISTPLGYGVLFTRGVVGLANHTTYSDDDLWQTTVSQYVYPSILLFVGGIGITEGVGIGASRILGSFWARRALLTGFAAMAFCKLMDARAARRHANITQSGQYEWGSTTVNECNQFLTERFDREVHHWAETVKHSSDLVSLGIPGWEWIGAIVSWSATAVQSRHEANRRNQ